MAISILNYYEQPDGKNLMIMADDLYERNPGEAPDDNMPMDPTNYAISQNLGIPADGSITIVRDFDENKKVKTVTNVFKEGEWKDSTEGGGGGGLKVEYIEPPTTLREFLTKLQENDIIFIKLSKELTGASVDYISTISAYFTIAHIVNVEYNGTYMSISLDEDGDDCSAEIADILTTKYPYNVGIGLT